MVLVENLPVPLDRRTWQESVALARAGWDVTVIGPRGAGDMRRLHDRIDGVEICRYPQRAASGLAGYLVEYLPSILFTAAWLAWTRLRGGAIRVIHACNPPDLFWIFGVLAKARGGRFVFDQHDANVELAATKWGGRGATGQFLIGLTRWLEARSYRAADLVVSPNDSYRALAIGRGGVSGERAVVVRNAPDVAAYRTLAASIDRAIGTGSTDLRIGYVGVMGSQDGLDTLLDAWGRVVAQTDLADAVLELVGDGESRPALERQAAKLGLGSRIRFHGYQRPEAFVPVLAGCVAGVSPDPPTPFNEVSTMVKVVDYLAIGLPVVAFDLKESQLVVGRAGVFVRPATAEALAAALAHLLRDPQQAARLAAETSGRVSALDLDWSRSAARLVAAYETLR